MTAVTAMIYDGYVRRKKEEHFEVSKKNTFTKNNTFKTDENDITATFATVLGFTFWLNSS